MAQRLMVFFIGILLTLRSTSDLLGVWEQPPIETGNSFHPTAIASDANGNGAVIVADRDVRVYNYFSSTNTWSPPTLLQSNVEGDVDIAMDNSGRAIAIWSNNLGTNEVRTALFDGSTWTLGSPDPLEVGTFIFSPKVSMNGPSGAVAAWIDDTVVRSSFFTGGPWSAPTTIGTTNRRSVRIAYSSNGTAVAGFINMDAVAANYIGGVWQAPVTLNTGTVFNSVEVGIDADGNALALWEDNPTVSLLSSFFNGSSWQAPVTLDGTTPFSRIFSLTMAPTGTAVAAWTVLSGVSPSPGLSRVFDGAAWGPVLQITPDVAFNPSIGNTIALGSDDFGNAIVLFSVPTTPPLSSLFSARLPIGSGVWTNYQKVADASPANPFLPFFGFLDTDLSNNGYAFASFTNNNSEAFFNFASVDPLILPPASIDGAVCKTPIDRINIITFTPSPSTVVVSYELSRNGRLIAIIPASGPFIYFDNNRCKNVTDVYSLVAVGPDGLVSTPVTVTFN